MTDIEALQFFATMIGSGMFFGIVMALLFEWWNS